ncbi:MAG: B12-binding domain-containing radical SAM protein [Verrucomicrobia bacterium]|nr:MAG: B12-binding domain-containing radical SAM protein [Verrucomicrobiota bacterium]
MKALLLYPEFPDTFWSFKHVLKFIRKRAALPPLGLLTVAAMLPEEWEKRLVDVNVRALREKDIAWADVVLISAMIAQRDSTVQLIARCRAAGKTVVAGGPLFTVEHAQFPDVDHLVLNEAETTLPEFLQDFAQGSARRVYTSTNLPDLRPTPAPLWELADLQRYASMSVQYSRGCPFDCEFCSVTAMFGHRPRVKTPAQIIAELDGLWQRGWRGTVFFVDDNLIGNKRSLRNDLLPALIRWRKKKRGFTFYTEASINLADDTELMQLMVTAGFDQVFIGIETPEEASLTECNKRQNRSRNLIADVKRIQRAGLQVQGGFIVGFDNDPPMIFQRQIDFIQESGIVTAMVGILQAIPGTKLHERLFQQGRLLGDTTGDNVDGTTNFIPRMNRETLRDGYRQLMDTLYAPGPYYRRIRTFLREFKPPRISGKVNWRNAFAFISASLRLGVIGRERFHFWGLLLWTCFRRPTLVPMAVTLSIYGFHFRKCCLALGA